MEKIEIDCYELLVADCVGVRDNHFAYVANSRIGDEWQRKQPAYRSVRKFTKAFHIFNSVEELDMDVKQELIKSAMQKLNPDEINALGLS